MPVSGFAMLCSLTLVKSEAYNFASIMQFILHDTQSRIPFKDDEEFLHRCGFAIGI
jgi:hypothetical protein